MFLERVRLTIAKHRMLRQRDRVLIAVSGGPDSLALFAALVALRQEWRLNLQVAYVDHRLRPLAARREAALVKKMGRIWGVPVSILRCPTRRRAGESLEALARELRYEALTRLAQAQRCELIAVGHTQDDQAETILMWLLRGTGTTGLSGIPPLREVRGLKIIRPLIDCSRAQVEAYLKDSGIRPLKDRSNDSLRYLRNRIRHELIPLLERQYNPQLRRHLAHLGAVVREDLGWLERQAKEKFCATAHLRPRQVLLNRRRLEKAPASIRTRVLRISVEHLQGNVYGFGSRHWLALDELLLNGEAGAMDLPHGLRAQVTKENLMVSLSGTARSGKLLSICRR